MNTKMKNAMILLLGLVLILSGCNRSRNLDKNGNAQFKLKYTEELSSEPIRGRALLILSADTLVDPDLPNPMRPFITIGIDFKNWKPGEELMVTNENSDGFMSGVADLSGDYSMRVILDLDTTSANLMQAGFGYSDMSVIHIDQGESSKTSDFVNNIYPGEKFEESESVKLLKVQSKMLSDFHGFPVFIESAVILPSFYDSCESRSYPTVFVFPGWGTTHVNASSDQFQQTRYGMTGYSDDKIYLVMNQDCRWGYHVFADSDNNGPRATSFIEEFIPAYESQYRAIKDPIARFMVGQSSGAWASLWLLVNYPDQFALAWAGSPDPVDFRDFIGHDLYAPDANLFYDAGGKESRSMRSDEITFTNKDWSDMETAMGEGGQYQSFEAVFGTKGKDGKPSQLFNRSSGKISAKELKHWKQYDISEFIKEHTAGLTSKLAGKINVVVAGDDSFYLNGSVELLGETLKELGIDANIKILPSGGHNTWSEDIKREFHAKMDKIK